MLDLKQLANDIADLAAAKNLTYRDLDEVSGVNFGKIQRFLSKSQSSLPIEDVAALLEVCDTSLIIYLGQVDMLKDLNVLEEDRDIAEMFKRLLKIPAKRAAIKTYFEALLLDLPHSEQSPSGSHAKRRVPSGGHHK